MLASIGWANACIHNVGVASTNLNWSTTLKPRREGRGEPTKEVEWDAEGPTNKTHKQNKK